MHGWTVEVLPDNRLKVLGCVTADGGRLVLDDVLTFSDSGAVTVQTVDPNGLEMYQPVTYPNVLRYLGYDDNEE